ncbi:mas-related G-protein coupled receptor member H-like [Gracilinanus agilis]|uniref:mas-related G-protein coupled receptor member H-like n=1 Tax=Gracilinanus agilis TaxID=191870 RepID=UPI001CFF28BA|nr:mas-related G-protein coupled receptor member H-like [Gracilinanus agilis]
MVLSSTSRPSMESTTDAQSHVNGSFLNSQSTEMILAFVSLFITLLGTAGNGFIIWFLIFHFKKNPFTVYILHLSIADLTFLLCAFTLLIGIMINYSSNNVSFRMQLFLVIFVVLVLFGYNTGLYLLTAVSVERCLSVLYPIWYQCQRPKHQSAVVCTMLWVLSVFATLLEGSMYVWEIESSFRFRIIMQIVLLILNFLVFAPLMVISSLTLFIKVLCNLKHRQPVRLYIIIITTVILFLLFAMPWRFSMIMSNFEAINYDSLRFLFPYFTMLSFINSSVNPIVYVVVGRLRRQRTRKSLKETLQKVFEDKSHPRARS